MDPRSPSWQSDLPAPRRLEAEEKSSRPDGLAAGVTEIALEETASTNAHALELLKAGAEAPHLTLVWARRQTKGRGRGCAHGLGERITVRTSLDLDESVSGVFEGIDGDGALLLRLADGTVRPLVVGDVFFGDPRNAKETL